MITFYLRDQQNIYSGSVTINPFEPVPPLAVSIPPPETTGTEVARWNGVKWDVLPERPTPPAPPPPPEPVPEEIEGWQGEVVMRAMAVDPDDPESQSVWDRVQDLIAAMPDGIEKITAQTVLRRGRIRRDSPTLAQLAPLVPLTQDRIDDMFRLGGSIQA